MRTLVPILAIASFVIAFAHLGPNPFRAETPGVRKEAVMSFQLISAAFLPHGAIPRRHTCDGEDLSPQLAWHSAPEGTKSFALVVDDPDAPDPAAPKMTWVHWVLYDIPLKASSLREAIATRQLPAGTREGLNDWKDTGWRGPCPPNGRHRYHFKLYALDEVLADLHRPAKAALEKAMEGHVLGKAELVGTYQRAKVPSDQAATQR
jgi:Raf kinase inhibitor-like YbhB/YbcL family protein